MLPFSQARWSHSKEKEFPSFPQYSKKKKSKKKEEQKKEEKKIQKKEAKVPPMK